MNHWLDRHIRRRPDIEINDNYAPIQLTWREEQYDDMPVVRENFLEMQAGWAIYMTQMEVESNERNNYYGNRIYS